MMRSNEHASDTDERVNSGENGPNSRQGARVVARDTTKIFPTTDGPITAVEQIDLDVHAGEFLVIVGPSGCGKSTLLRMIAELDSPTTGSIQLSSPGSNRKPTNSMVFHGRTLFPWLSLRSNVAYGLQMQGESKRQSLNQADQLLETVGLYQFRNSWPHQVSEGMRQRTSLARALATDPQLLLMDEPFGALDEQTRYILQEELLSIWDNTGKTVIFVTHSIEEALLLGDRVVVMTARPGKIADDITVPFERPRNLTTIRSHQEFGVLFDRIWSRLREEVERGGAFG